MSRVDNADLNITVVQGIINRRELCVHVILGSTLDPNSANELD